MKATLYSPTGEKKGQVELPTVFETKIREDLALKQYETSKIAQLYSAKEGAGLRQSASGTISHRRHAWKGHYGKGISRTPRKTMWRRGTQFFWIAANAPGTRGGRKAHPPKGFPDNKKINKKEMVKAMSSAFASTADLHYIRLRYASLKDLKEAPFVIESIPKKTSELISSLKSIFTDNFHLVFKSKKTRAGKGKLRNRKYKSNAGLLLIVSKDETKQFKGVTIKTPSEVNIADLYPLGRLTLYTKKSLEEIQNWSQHDI